MASVFVLMILLPFLLILPCFGSQFRIGSLSISNASLFSLYSRTFCSLVYSIYLTFSHSSHVGAVLCVRYSFFRKMSAALVSVFSFPHTRSSTNGDNRGADIHGELYIDDPAYIIFCLYGPSPCSALHSCCRCSHPPLGLSQNMELPFFVCPKTLFHTPSRSHSEKGERIS
jgi:hypothetical protein